MAGLGLAPRNTIGSLCSGIVVKAADTGCFNNLDGSNTNPFDQNNLDTHLSTSNTGIRTSSIPAQEMPQLTIQYRAPVDIRDCEGNLALGPRKVTAVSNKVPDTDNKILVDGQVIVERYFVKKNGDSFELRCDAGRYVVENITADTHPEQSAVIVNSNAVRNLGDEGALVIAGIDHFDLQLGVKVNDNIKYQSIKDAFANHPNTPVVSVRLAVLAKGNVAVPKTDTNNTIYTVFGKDIAYKPNATGKQSIRRVYESNVMLRNARGLNAFLSS